MLLLGPAIVIADLSCDGGKMVPRELSIMEGFLEEVMSKLRLKEWEGINQAGRERKEGISLAGRERW